MGKGQIETEGEVYEGAGRMPAPQRARRPRYIGWMGFYIHVASPACRRGNRCHLRSMRMTPTPSMGTVWGVIYSGVDSPSFTNRFAWRAILD